MIQNIKEFCRLFYRTTFIPIAYYTNPTKIDCSFPYPPKTVDLTKEILFNLTLDTKNPNYFISHSQIYYGIVRLNQQSGFIIIGPVFSSPPTQELIQTFTGELLLSTDVQSEIEHLLMQVPVNSFNHFLETLVYLHLCLNDESLTLVEHFNLLNADAYKAVSTLYSNQSYEIKEKEDFHNTYHFEQQYLEYIKTGEPAKLKSFLSENSLVLKAGKVADNALRQAKNIFISAATQVTRAAISGGLDIEQAYQLSDTYIKECEKLQSLDMLTNLTFTMNLDFAERVAQCKISTGLSKDIFECIQYVSSHTNVPLSVTDVATHIGRSRSYVSRKFKAELGYDLSSFIMHCKLEEAKSLLAYSYKSLSEISNYLCFSSQSYFQNVFKKKYGLTPMQYRNQTIH